MNSKQKSIFKLTAVFVVIAILVLVALVGVGDALPGVFSDGAINKGLDLVGGSYIVYEADIDEADENLADNMNAVKSMMRSRLDTLGYTEGTVTLSGDRRVIIEIPNISDPEEAVQKLGSTAVLQFVDYENNVILEGSDIVRADASYGDATGRGYPTWFISLKLSDEAVKKFSDATLRVSKLKDNKNYIAITLDGEQLSAPFVTEQLTMSDVVITGNYDQESAQWLAGVITSGQLPFALREVQLDSVGPTLGEKALSTSIIAGGIGIALVMIFMIVMYRLPGAIASIALVAYIAMTGIILVLFQINLSLPGIAGIILSIGMAVDANVVIFERIKDELRIGKSTGAAVKSGFKRAFTAVLDSNITTLIASCVLWYFGTGTVQGFAITLFIGVLLSMVSAIIITRILLNSLVGLNVRNPKLYGA
ncbi:MAG: protein translocase subunit SecD [Clostridiales bacterium]|nr:protein translocase subunit SecD [Clostridiales bacterium]